MSKAYLASTSPKRNLGWTLFQEILSDYAKRFASKFQVEGRKIALIIDYCLVHPNVNNLKAIELVFLPPSTTSKTQPKDQSFSGTTRALDISKAFDRVWHAGLLHKHRSYGISGQMFDLISSFLSNRRIRVVLNGNFWTNWLLHLNLICETLWTGARSGFLISMLEKRNWFCLIDLMTLVLLIANGWVCPWGKIIF